MKFILGLFVMAFTFNLAAQDLPKIQEMERTMSNGSKNGFTVEYKGISEKIVENEWRDLMKNNKAKVKKSKAKEWFADDAKMRDLSNNSVDVYAITSFDKAADKTYFTVWFDLGGAYLSSEAHPDQAISVKNIMDKLSMNVMREDAKENMEVQAKDLKGLQGDLKKLEKDKEEHEKAIEKAKETIKEMEAKIETNVKGQDTKNAEIKAQEKVLEEAKKEVSKYGGK